MPLIINDCRKTSDHELKAKVWDYLSVLMRLDHAKRMGSHGPYSLSVSIDDLERYLMDKDEVRYERPRLKQILKGLLEEKKLEHTTNIHTGGRKAYHIQYTSNHVKQIKKEGQRVEC